MCGITGQLSLAGGIDKAVFREMNNELAHRGPDGEGHYSTIDNRIHLGHRRLALIDLTETGAQPMPNENKTIRLICNGEIYNYVELRSELEKQGHLFFSKSDAEVIIHGYEQWGIHVIQRLKGMFAFAVLDENKKKLFLVRDRFGIKPLYYYHDSNGFIFASEIKAILKNKSVKRELDFSSLCDFLVYRFIPSPKTIWKKISKLPPAHYLEIDFNGIMRLHEYWTLTAGDKKIKENELVEKTGHLLKESLSLHLRSDVPIGTFLSGGYDSSSLVMYQDMLHYHPITFSAGFENWENSEHQYAAMAASAFDARHKFTLIDSTGFEALEKLMYYYDEPIADISILPTYLLSKFAAQDVKAVLSGEGADEIFCGYTWHQPPPHNFLMRKVKKAFNIPFSGYPYENYCEAMAMGRFDFSILAGLLHEDLAQFISRNPDWFYKKNFNETIRGVKRYQYADIKSFMGELVLTKVDRASMANSLEVRVPFLDHELAEFIFGLHPDVYFKYGIKKFPLFENIKDKMPAEILNRPKQGFTGPDSFYMNYSWYEDVLKGGRLIKEKFIREEKLQEMLQQKDHWRLWKLAVLEFWMRNWL